VTSPPRRFYRPMTARSAHEPHRSATPLELFFDLCFVVAVAQAAALLHHDVAEDHIGAGVLAYLMVFFAIWWAWMNFTWFASAYDTDDDVYRLTALVTIAGALVIAAGIPSAFDDRNFVVVTIGYTVMRLANVAQWLRAAHGDPPRRRTARRFAIGVALVQAGWIARLFQPEWVGLWGFLVLVVAELLVPAWAERAEPTTWHPHHIAERYGLFTLIVLGETVLAASIAVQAGLAEGFDAGLLWIAAGGVVLVFAMWWLYFDRDAAPVLRTLRTSMRWGYGHYFVFASAAATGAGIAVAVDHHLHKAHIPAVATGFAIAVPVAVYVMSVWLLHVRPHQRGPIVAALPVGALLVLLTPFLPAVAQVPAVGLVLAGLVALTVAVGRRTGDPLAEGSDGGQLEDGRLDRA
jgi:low temperature requirement protein LtrA